MIVEKPKREPGGRPRARVPSNALVRGRNAGLLTRTGQGVLLAAGLLVASCLAAMARPWSKTADAEPILPLEARGDVTLPVPDEEPAPARAEPNQPAPAVAVPSPPPPAPAPPASVAPPAPAVTTRTIRMRVTAYCPCRVCCGRHSDGKTASGKSILTNGSHFVAADTRLLAFGTRVSVPGYYAGAPVPVLDRGARIKGRRLDVFFRSHQRAKRWGTRWLNVTVYEAR